MKAEFKHLNNLYLLFTLLTFFSFHFFPTESKAYSLSIEAEEKLGGEFLDKIRKKFEVVDDDFVRGYINDLGNYLIRPLKTKHFPFRFYVLKGNSLNAFAGPGGHIFIFSGLIEAFDGIDELAAVLCHEIAHVSARHLAQRIEQTKKIGIASMAGMLAGVFVGGQVGRALSTGSAAAGIQAQLHYSRNDERQADQLGYRYMTRAAFDPAGMITTLKKFQQELSLITDSIPPYLLSHPGTVERMSNMDIMLTDNTPGAKNENTVRFRKQFPFLKTILRAKYLDSHEAERLFSSELEKDPDSSIAHFGLGLVWKERSEFDKSINSLVKAFRDSSQPLHILRNLGEVYQLQGNDAKTIKILESALKIDSGDKSILLLLAISYENLEEYPKAVHLLEKLASMKPVKDEIYYHLGVSYGRQDRLALAHYNFGRYFKRQKKVGKAKFHFEKAHELSENDPRLKNKIRKAMKDLT